MKLGAIPSRMCQFRLVCGMWISPMHEEALYFQHVKTTFSPDSSITREEAVLSCRNQCCSRIPANLLTDGGAGEWSQGLCARQPGTGLVNSYPDGASAQNQITPAERRRSWW